MKKRIAIYIAISMLILVSSCVNSDTDEELSPYAIITSFKLGNIQSDYPAFTATGEDTVVTKTILGSSFPFTIDQAACRIFNADSLPYATNVDKVVMDMQLDGYAMIYVDSIGEYDYFAATDSIDFSYPRKFRITSLNGESHRDYTVSVNVHQVDPDLMVWNRYRSVSGMRPLRALEFDGKMALFGENGGNLVVATSGLEGAPVWQLSTVSGLPATADLSTVQLFKGALYLVADDGVYTSSNAIDWALSYAHTGLHAIVGASDDDGKMLVVGDDCILSTTDGCTFDVTGLLPSGFPLYGISIASNTMSHNSGIVRYMAVGYATREMSGDAVVWSRLSTENGWVKYDNRNNPYPCPSLKGLSVVEFDNFLYAVGGAGVAQGKNVGAFSSFYVSKDKGTTWKELDDFYQRLPNDLKGDDSPFAVTVDSNNMMWIIIAGDEPVAWKGTVNRLGFKN